MTRRELNRATLSRQLLLERAALPVSDGVERLVGLQAQQPVAPFVGLWTRLSQFDRNRLADLVGQRTIVKATMMRGTLHLVSAADYRRFRATLQPVLTGASASIAKRRGAAVDVDRLVEAARRFVGEAPRTFAEITAMLVELEPEGDPGAMRYSVRTHLPLVQVPTDTAWCYPGNPRFALAESWLGAELPSAVDVRGLVRRYLAAFGPATVADIQTWSGLAGLKEEVGLLRNELLVLRDERGRELFDLPDSPRPGEGAVAPVRFLPEYDNLLLSHRDRTRVVADEHRAKVFLPGLRVRSTFLADGFVAGAWKVESSRGASTLVIEPFGALPAESRRELEGEAERLVRFIAGDGRTVDVGFAG